MSAFENVVPALARALETRGFDALTAVQSAVLAPDLEAADLVVSAQTGSGKTVAFGLSLANTLLGGEPKLAPAGAPLALIIAPTRELAMQVRGELEWLYAPTGGRIASCVGGMDMRDERRLLGQGAHIVVGTPGRLVDHIRRGSLDMKHLKAVVLDEADEMLNLGFREELEFILESSPAERRTLMFSATMPRAIEALAKTYQRDAVRVNTVSGRAQHADIEYRALVAAGHESESAIFNVLRFYNPTNALVFCGTRAAVTRLESRFSNRGLSVVALSGELSQNARTHALQALRDHRAQVCVATDVAARGIDLPDLELVIHADLPKNREALLHRSGRTGRAGRKGASVLIVPYSARKRTERLLRDSGIEAKWGEPPSADDIRRRDDERLLADPLLQTEPEAIEQAAVSALLAQHDAAHIAAAFVRLYRKGQAAPEDLAPTQVWSPTSDRPERAPRGERTERVERGPPLAVPDNFTPGAWVSLSVGRGRNAEPKWLIPMLCKAGGITKRQLGSIRIDQDETFVEIDAGIVDEFLARIGKGGHIEKSIHVKRIAGAPAQQERRPKHSKSEAYAERPAPGADNKYAERPAPRADQYAERPAPRAEKYADRQAPRPDKYAERPKPRADKPPHRGQPPKPHGKPAGKGDRKPFAGKPFGAAQRVDAKHTGAKHTGAAKPKKKWRPD